MNEPTSHSKCRMVQVAWCTPPRPRAGRTDPRASVRIVCLGAASVPIEHRTANWSELPKLLPMPLARQHRRTNAVKSTHPRSRSASVNASLRTPQCPPCTASEAASGKSACDTRSVYIMRASLSITISYYFSRKFTICPVDSKSPTQYNAIGNARQSCLPDAIRAVGQNQRGDRR